MLTKGEKISNLGFILILWFTSILHTWQQGGTYNTAVRDLFNF